MLGMAVLLVSLCATGMAWWVTRQAEHQRHQARLARFVGRTERNLQNRLGRYEDLARGAQGYFAGDPRHRTPESWHEYVKRLGLPERHPGLINLIFIARVPPAELTAYLQERPQLASRFRRPHDQPADAVGPIPQGDHLIIELFEPADLADPGLGLDLGGSLTRRLTAERARESGLPALSGVLQFQTPTGPQDAVALYVPVYADSLLGAGSPVLGWVSAGILINPLIEDVLRGEDQDIALEVYDATATVGPRTIRSAPDWPRDAQPAEVRRVFLGGRAWELRYGIRPEFYRSEGRRQSSVFFFGGLALACSLAGLVWALSSTRQRAIALAETRSESLREALQRNRSHLDHTPLAVIETDAQFRIREWNNAATRIFGHTRDEALGQDPSLLLPEEAHPEVAARREALMAASSGVRITLENVTKDGRPIYCDWYNTALRDPAGAFVGAIFLADDITERRRAESALRQAQKLESLGVLAGGIAHDFNNLLTAILGNADMAQAQAPPGLLPILDRIESTAQRGSDLARQLLAYAGKARFEIRPLDLNAIILEMGDLLSVSIPKMVALRTELHPGLPAVDADSAQFQQVVMNLVINAAEAIGTDTGTVVLRTRKQVCTAAELAEAFPGQVLEPGTFVRLEVEDDGCGMDAETIGRIFDPFFTTKFTGRGLGLSAMLGIVRGHRAGIRVESTPGVGTTFVLLFPASTAPKADPSLSSGPVLHLAGTVLVVDDEGIIRELARSALEASGYKVVEARDGLEALQVFQAAPERVSLVFMDMTMPRMGGAEAFRRIRELDPDVPVLLTSGYTQRESLESLADLPPDGFLQKPFRVKELVRKVAEILKARRGDSSTV